MRPTCAVRAVTAPVIRAELAAAQAAAWAHVTSAGSCWSGAQRAAIARAALAALDDPDPLQPWVTPSAAGRPLPGTEAVPAVVADAAYRRDDGGDLSPACQLEVAPREGTSLGYGALQ
jgi:hypothetical protein